MSAISRWYRGVQAGITLLILSSLVILAAFPGSTAASRSLEPPASPRSHKVLVDATDQATRTELKAAGARLLADYGSFSLWSAPAAYLASFGERASAAVRADFDRIGLRDGFIDTVAGAAEVPAQLRQTRASGDQLWLVQFVGPTQDRWLEQLRSLGLQIIIPMPQNAYLVWGAAASLTALDRLVEQTAFVQWAGAYHPAYRLEPGLQRLAQTAPSHELIDVTVQLLTTPAIDQSLQRLRALGGQIYTGPGQSLGFTNIALQVPAGQLIGLANWADIYNIESWAAPEKLDEAQGQIVAGNVVPFGTKQVPSGPGYLAWLASKGFPTTPASYPIVDIVDDGLDQGNPSNVLHPDFHELGLLANPDRVPYIGNCTNDPTGNNESGHGTINAGIVAAYNNLTGSPHVDSAGYRLGLGISPYGRVASTKVYKNNGFYNISACGGSNAGVVAASYNAGAAITSNSWGTIAGGAYNTTAQAYDALTRDAASATGGNQQMLHVAAAGNVGNANTIFSPATAKNVLSVGATESVRDNGVIDGCFDVDADSADDLYRRSSQGPTDDGRIKPEIMAPATHVQGPASQDPFFTGTGICGNDEPVSGYYPLGQTLYTWHSGTSMAAAAVAGAASLIYEYYGRILNPGQTPSPAMLKALMVNTPRYMNGLNTGGTLPSNAQGWGDINLGAIFDGQQRTLNDQNTTLGATGDTFQSVGSVVSSAKPVHVSLVWTDAPGSTTGNAYVNNLDLEVTVGGQTYKGNVFSGANSITGGSFDPKNNTENVFIPAGVSGSLSVRVIAANLAGDGVPGNPDLTDQDFALVIYNGTNQPTANLAVTNVTTTPSGGNNNGVIDPGEEVLMNISLTNAGNVAATNATGVISVVSGNATVINATSTYANIVPNATATNSTPYRFMINANQPCGVPVVLRHTVTYTGGPTFIHDITVPTGAPYVGAAVTHVSTDVPRAIPDNNPAGVAAILPISSPGTVGDLNVLVSITHSFVGDLKLVLKAPDGTEVLLANRQGLNGDNFSATRFDDEAATAIVSGTAPFAGSFRPLQPLAVLDDTPLNGTWQLFVVDQSPSDVGSITDFALEIGPRNFDCNATPIAGLTATNDGPHFVGQATRFSATVTSGSLITYSWDFGDGTTGSGAMPSHVYSAPGTYTVTVTASNALGTATSTTTVVVTNGIFLPRVTK